MSATAYKQVHVSSIIQIVIGALCMVLGIIERVTDWRGTLTSIPCLAIWMGLWICITGVIGVIAKVQMRGPSKALVGVYMGFSIVSVVMASTMIICYSLVIAFYNGYYFAYGSFVVRIMILVLSIFEFGVGIWSSVCCCVIGPCCGQQVQMVGTGQVMYQMQHQGSAPVSYVIVQGPDGTPVAVPAQAGGPIPSSTPLYSQGGAVGTSFPPQYQVAVHAQQQPPQSQQNEVKGSW